MIKTVKFTKMHGAGNDYIYVDTLLYSIPDPSAAAIKWSAPHTGIGYVGLVCELVVIYEQRNKLKWYSLANLQ